jgi:plasmid stabilization system protein ParE
MTGYEFHPAADVDLDTIWDYIAGHNVGAADRVMEEIEAAIKLSCLFPIRGIVVKT